MRGYRHFFSSIFASIRGVAERFRLQDQSKNGLSDPSYFFETNLVFAISIISFLLLSFDLFGRGIHPAALDYYFLFVLGMVLLLAYFQRDTIFRKEKWRRLDCWFPIVFLALVFLLMLSKINRVSLWLDESYHINYVLSHSAMSAGILQVNPPLHGLFVVPLLSFLDTPWMFRLPAMIFGILAGGVVWRIFYRKTGFLSLSSVLCVLYFSHPLIELFGREARPVTLGMLCMLLFLSSFFRILEFGINFKSLAFFHVSFCLSLFALGFQPVALGFGVGLFCLWKLISDRSYLVIIFSLLLNILTFFPLQLTLIQNSPTSVGSIISGNVSPFFQSYRHDSFSLIFAYYFSPYFLIPLIGILFIFIARFIFKKTLRESVIQNADSNYKTNSISSGLISQSQRDSLWFCILGIVSFVCIFSPLFLAYANGPFRMYYILGLFPLVLALFALLFKLFIQAAGNKASKVLLLAVHVTVIGILVFRWNVPDDFFLEYDRLDAKTTYEGIAAEANASGSFWLVEVCPFGANRWCPEEPSYAKIYLETLLSRTRLNDSIFPKKNIFHSLEENFRSPIATENIYFVFHAMKPRRAVALVNFLKGQIEYSMLNFHIKYGFVVLRIPVDRTEDARFHVKRLFEKLGNFCGEIGSDCFWVDVSLHSSLKGAGLTSEAEIVRERVLKSEQDLVRKGWRNENYIDLEKFFGPSFEPVIRPEAK